MSEGTHSDFILMKKYKWCEDYENLQSLNCVERKRVVFIEENLSSKFLDISGIGHRIFNMVTFPHTLKFLRKGIFRDIMNK